jgi:hypothetical protein
LVDLDGTARIAGLGSALILDHITPQPDMSAECLFRGSAPELIHPEEFGLPRPQKSKAGDVYAYGTLVWEVKVLFSFHCPNHSLRRPPQIFTGRAVFSCYLDVIAAYTMWKGVLPPRPNHPEATDRMCKMMEQCWERKPSKRTTIKAVGQTLEAERTAKFYAAL